MGHPLLPAHILEYVVLSIQENSFDLGSVGARVSQADVFDH